MVVDIPVICVGLSGLLSINLFSQKTLSWKNMSPENHYLRPSASLPLMLTKALRMAIVSAYMCFYPNVSHTVLSELFQELEECMYFFIKAI